MLITAFTSQFDHLPQNESYCRKTYSCLFSLSTICLALRQTIELTFRHFFLPFAFQKFDVFLTLFLTDCFLTNQLCSKKNLQIKFCEVKFFSHFLNKNKINMSKCLFIFQVSNLLIESASLNGLININYYPRDVGVKNEPLMTQRHWMAMMTGMRTWKFKILKNLELCTWNLKKNWEICSKIWMKIKLNFSNYYLDRFLILNFNLISNPV